jgi:hypothetical protein
MSGPNRPNVVTTAADFVAKMQWRPFDFEKPPSASRILVCRKIKGQTYVDVTAYMEEEPCGLPPAFDMRHVVAWMPLPEPPG